MSDQLPFQPQNRRAGYHEDPLVRILTWLDRHPHSTLASGEGAILAAEIHRLRALLGWRDPRPGAPDV